MTPSNPQPSTPNILKFEDNQGLQHAAVAVQHSHTIAEVTDLQSELNSKADKNAIRNGTNQVSIGNTGIVSVIGSKVIIDVGATDDAEITASNIANLIRALADPDSTPTYNSDKLVTSHGVWRGLANKKSLLDYESVVEVNANIAYIAGVDAIRLGIGASNSRNWIILDVNNWANLQRVLTTPDTTPTSDSDNLVTSGGVKTALDGKAYIQDGGEGNISLSTDEENKSYAEIHANDYIQLGITAASPENIQITPQNWGNLIRALRNPASTPEYLGDDLMTSGGIWTALRNQMKNIHLEIDSNGVYSTTDSSVYNTLNTFVRTSDKEKDYPCHFEIYKTNSGGGVSTYDISGFIRYEKSTNGYIYIYITIGTHILSLSGTYTGELTTLSWNSTLNKHDYSSELF